MNDNPFSNLRCDPVSLRFVEVQRGTPERGLVPSYHFTIVNTKGTEVGHINFRVGDARHLLMTAGHIGYGILPEHRGASYSYYACLALAPFARSHYERLILTVDPDNAPSIRIIEKLGARFIEEVDVPLDDPDMKMAHDGKEDMNGSPDPPVKL